jgi:hypothetical protein
MTTSAKVAAILEQIAVLDEAEQVELHTHWQSTLPPINNHANGYAKDAAAFDWINEHGSAYSGEWLALDGDRLLAHGEDLKAVAAAARAQGVEFPLLHLVEPPRPHPYIHD